jgi:transaldolase
MPNKLESLKESTIIVADTGEIETIRRLKPQDCTTNPTLLFKAAQSDAYQSVVADAIARAGAKGGADVDSVADMLSVSFGAELLQVVPGFVSTEVDADLSFDTDATIAKAKWLIDLYAEMGADTDRVLIKIASTWEGIKAAEKLQKEGIKCNLTLLFGMPQAVACADAGVTLISPFVGRIRDWFIKAGHTDFDDESDPGVVFVRRVYSYYKRHGCETIVMGASFRTAGEIEALAGCDRLTISPALLDELASQEGEVERKLTPSLAGRLGEDGLDASEPAFRWGMNEDPMATEKLAEGIRQFNNDLVSLKKLLATKL